MPGSFPILRSGAIAQYPLVRELRENAEVVRFLDGSAQAYRNQPGPFRRWVIDLALLDEIELGALRQFFEQQKGGWGSFGFNDPFSGETFAACSFENDQFPESQEAEGRNAVRLVICQHA